ncbi:YceI family protein [Saccharopolyspora phatthalungensis]|uniref:Polyisoprenoid-binding protein YceI n=1 Tax=Saccharopolyspora phatthalungensis TaxID=664693 RepID=A0A840Q264_9PSEU|nr:YceI family protein [Saccharopolyspora phatthalungensis]MBB5152819.1 polyisoprenoid-binding protein YceI [Saccharopolyspora phatthalungensis]
MTATAQIPGYVAGTWDIDPAHSNVEFSVRHMGVAKSRGRFGSFRGEIVTAADPLESTVTATIEAASIDTRQADRDAHLRSADFLDVEQFPTLTFRSTGVRQDGDDFVIDGEFTLRGVTKPVSLATELGGFTENGLLGLSASVTINRTDFGVGPAGSAKVSEKVKITLDIEAQRRD